MDDTPQTGQQEQQEQQEEMIITREDQARALQEVGFLGQFVEPASPSEVAKRLGMAANLAHYHAQRHAALGLLLAVKRDNGRVYYQLAAKTFKHDPNLLPFGDPYERSAATLTCLSERFLEAYQRSDYKSGQKSDQEDRQDPGWAVYGFNSPYKLPADPAEPLEPYPAHLQTRTVPLTPKRYRELVRHIRKLLEETEKEEANAAPCTLALLAFGGVLQEGSENSRDISSFVPPEEA